MLPRVVWVYRRQLTTRRSHSRRIGCGSLPALHVARGVQWRDYPVGGAKIDLSRAQELIQGRETVTDLDRTSDIQFTGGPDRKARRSRVSLNDNQPAPHHAVCVRLPHTRHGWLGDTIGDGRRSMYARHTMHNFFVSTLIGDQLPGQPAHPVAVPGSGKKVVFPGRQRRETYRV